LAISSVKKGQILKWWKRPNKGQILKENLPKYVKKNLNIIKCCMFCWNFAKIGLKRYYFPQDWKKAKKRQNGQILLFLETVSKKAKWQPWFTASNIFLSPDSRVIVALCGGQGGTSFDPVQRVTGTNPFKKYLRPCK
jgi:hypothetical protein